MLLGGRVAEEIKFGEISTGAQNDLYRATDIAKSMVKEYGMSEKLGYVAFEKNRKPIFLDITPSFGEKDYSEETAREIDNEIKAIIDNAYKTTKEILMANKELLDSVAQRLLEKETIDGEELRKLIKGNSGEDDTDKQGKEQN